MGNAYRSVLALKPTGDAVPANVLAGKTFSNADGTGKTGTMVNNGAVSVTLTDQDPTYTIPEGYHNGSGVVGFSASGGDGADLIVTCSSAFAGATISCTDGTSTYQQICPSTAPFEVVFESIPVGTWTISGTAGGTLFSTQFTVVDFETVLNSIPEGSTVIPTDDIQTWLNCANIWDKSYTTISEILSDSSTLQSLIASNNAADYMARSSTWASDITANSSAMTYIGLNDYCSDALLADSTWLTAICNSAYFESVLNVKIPTMTSNTQPSGIASASSVYSGGSWPYDAYVAFNPNFHNSGWYPQTTSNQWLKYKFDTPMKAKAVTVSSISGSITSIKLYGSNDDSNYELISDTFNAPVTKKPLPLNSQKYLYYRFNVGNFNNSGFGMKAQLYGRA